MSKDTQNAKGGNSMADKGINGQETIEMETATPMEEVKAPVAEGKKEKAEGKKAKAATKGLDLAALQAGSTTSLDLVMNVPMQLSVEIGRTKKTLKEILEIGKDSLVVLDKQAGDSVDLTVNGQYVAKGDVVVVDDYFGIRITEVLSGDDMLGKL